jgi:hypothetical protein
MDEPRDPQTLEDTTRLLEAKLRLEGRAKNGASWFYWIAGLSILNSIILIAGGTFTFIFGLAFTQVIDVLAALIESDLGLESPGMISFLGFGFDIAVAGAFAAIGYLSRKRNRGVYIFGCVLFAADALVSLFFRDWLGALFHIFVLLGLWGGLKAMRALAPVEAGAATLESLRPAVMNPEEQSRSRRRIAFLVAAIVLVCLLGYAITWLQSR